jgi:hypothetical protein
MIFALALIILVVLAAGGLAVGYWRYRAQAAEKAAAATLPKAPTREVPINKLTFEDVLAIEEAVGVGEVVEVRMNNMGKAIVTHYSEVI